MRHELAIVMPVYNEQDCIASVVDSWLAMLAGQGIDFEMLILNDGSKDNTADVLRPYQSDPHVEVINKTNSGHGPTVLAGYHMAVSRGRWVFQCDSDDEMPAEAFPGLWRRRCDYDVLLGYRRGRVQSLQRRFISACSRVVVRSLFAKGIVDVNTPYRLMRAKPLGHIVKQIPPHTFAPNVIISGAFARAGVRICNYPVPHRPRHTGVESIVRWKLWKSAFRSFWQTLRCRPVLQASVCTEDDSELSQPLEK